MGAKDIIQNQKASKLAAHEHTDSGEYGMAASAIKEATDAGRLVLEEGGNAADAIIAIQLALAVVEGMNTGIGAGGFLVYYDSERDETKVLHGHSSAPEAVTPDLYVDEAGNMPPFDDRSIDAKSVGVPGIMRTLELAYNRYGSLPLERLIEPAIQLAENDYRVNFLWERTIDLFKDRMSDETKKLYVPNGTPLKEGDMVKQPELAKTLKLIRDKGFDCVYEGEIADAIINTVQEHGGLMTKEDLKGYKADVYEPLWSSYKEFDLAFPAPPNGGGFAVAQMLKMLEAFELKQYPPHSWEKYHIIAEAMRLTLADRHTYIGDPKFINIPLEGLMNPDYITERGKLIQLDRRMEKVHGGNPWKYQSGEKSERPYVESHQEGFETTHFTAVDRWGNVAACTSSIERIFGSGITVPGYGFLLNNDMTDFTPEPGTVNEPNSNKFAVSSKTPTIVFHEGKPFFTLGSPGAETIVASVLQVLLNVLEYEMDLEEAIQERRIYNTADLSIEWQDGINEEAMAKLKELGYHSDQSFKSVTADDRLGDIQAILIDPETGRLYGAADYPRPGEAEGVKQPPENSDK
ncbi:gamma-glutamyltransferase [Planococcus lenghuensis]|uniref:gamma-glutamyltransferase n=1 Tax=Planococcus lenghuensis TaxID=2213202 RepID=UPI00098425FE|nr:gamma-glutamyltransferase [Planococcus lenghuensis]